MNLRRLLRSRLAPFRTMLLIVVALQAVQTFASAMLPTLNADVIDQGVMVGDQGTIWRLGSIMLGVSFVQILFAGAAVWFGAQIAMGFGRDTRAAVFERVASFSSREIARLGAPTLITRITNDVQQVQALVVSAVTMMITAPLTMVIGTIMAMREDIGLSVVPLVAIPLAILTLGQVVYRMVPAFQEMQVRVDRLNGVLREQIAGMRVIRAFTREPEISARFGEANERLTDTGLRSAKLMAFMFPTVGLLLNASTIAVLWIGADRVQTGEIGVGSLVAYITYMTLILISVVMVTFMVSAIPRAAVAADRIMEVLDTETSVARPIDGVSEFPEHATVEFRDATFAYPGAEDPVLDGLTFRCEPGTTTAIIGSTGSGKSTLLGLVPRLFDTTRGSVLVDGVDVRRIDPSALTSRIGYVPQRAYLFAGTVASNLRFGDPDATDDQLWEALEIAQAAEFVRAMPDGLAARIEQGGTNVSGGQRQRLSIARALVVRPEVYLFDDSFSALDLATDARLRAALAPRVTDAVVLVVAQRVSTIVDADRIVVLERGRAVGIGTHQELIRTCPTYAEIVESQLGRGAVA
jgi:ATP-binding cassette, subfamily B, multidrug efflux pump